VNAILVALLGMDNMVSLLDTFPALVLVWETPDVVNWEEGRE